MSTTLSLGGFQERAPLRQCSPEELDQDAVNGFIQNIFGADMDPQAAALRCGITARTGQNIHPTAAGLLCFSALPQLMFPQWGLTCVRVNGCAITDPIHARADIEGPLPSLVQQAMEFLEQHTGLVPPTVQGGEGMAHTQHEYSVQALKELVTNALVHRDLKLTARVSVLVFDDSVVIRSPGGALFDPQAFELFSTEGGRSLPRNPLVASFARRLDLCEQVGRGLAVARRLTAELTSFSPT